MIAEQDYHNVMEWLSECQRPLLLTHQRPDGDALGAMGGLALALGQRGARPAAALYEPFPWRYTYFQEAARWTDWKTEGERLRRECDAVIVVDTCALAQLEPVAEWLPQAPRTLVIDHHTTRDAIGERPGDLRLIDVSASAVCLLIAEWVRATQVACSPLMATALFTGIATDCGWFRFPNTDARTLRVVAELVAAGASPNGIYGAVYQQDPPAKLRLVARMLDSLELHAGGKLAVMGLREADFVAAGADPNETEDLVNEAGRLGGIEATVLCTEQPGVIRINFRSRNALDVAALARQFGGGGHARAAGARVAGRWDEVVPAVVTAAVAALDEG
ncbi:MAG: DHHA1 domain-containing protein [Phycisphaerae bacterium]|jgi:phosphoesterase RecJ-like protein